MAELGVRVDEPDGSSTQTSPRLGLGNRPGGGATHLRASVGRAFELPSFFALASPPALGGNSELRPEIMEGADVGLDHSFADDRASVGLSVFHSRYEDLVDFDFATFSHVNRSRVRSRHETWSLAATWRFDDTWRLALRADNMADEDYETLIGFPGPERSVRLGLRYRLGAR